MRPSLSFRSPARRRLGGWLLLAVLYGAGVLHWCLFFGTAAEPLRGPVFSYEDWPKEYRYHSILQQAVGRAEVPYYISRPIHTRRFLALPEVNWSPQIALLRVVDVGQFVLLQTLLLYSAGFFGLLLLKRHLALGLVPFAFLFLLFAFNGHLTAHLGVGHSMWSGHFLLPFVLLGVLRLRQRPEDARTPPLLALLLFLLLLQGGFHAFVWCTMLLVLLVLFEPRLWRPVLATFAWAAPLAASRLLPAYFLLERKDQTFMSGFPSLLTLLRGLTSLVPASVPREGGLFQTLEWWEYDHYVGPAGLACLLYFGLWRGWRSRPQGWWRLAGPPIVLAALSIGDLYAPVNLLPLPLLSAERVSSRFLLLPLLLLGLLAAWQMQRWLEEAGGWRRAALGTVAVLLFALSLGAHSRLWRVESLKQIRPQRHGRLEIAIDRPPDPLAGRELAYVRTVHVSACLALGALPLVLTAALRMRRRAAPSGSAESVPFSGV